MFKSLRYFFYGAFLLLIITSYPAQAKLNCSKSKILIDNSFKDGYSFLSTAILDNYISVVLFIDQLGNFRIVGVDDDDNACIIMQGSNWQFTLDGVS